MEENKSCYHYKMLTFDDGFFNDSVDATYIIHLEGNGRHNDVQEQLKKYHPTNIVYILFNKGYKKCEKNLHEKKPAHDLTDAFLQIFKHANTNNYNNVLILEDDFFFTEKIKNPTVIEDINQFLNKKKNDKFVYYLGCIPYIQSVGYNHNTLFLSSGTHACIYSKKIREHVFDNHNQQDIIDWDIFNNMNYFHYYRYIYHEPLCYQLFPITENSKKWFNPFGLADLFKYIIKSFLLDKQIEPGYPFFYTFSKILFIFLLTFTIFMNIFMNMRMLSWYRIKFGKKLGKNAR